MIPRITWGASFANIIDFSDHFAEALCTVAPKEGAPNKVSRALTGTGTTGFFWGADCLLKGKLVRIPQTTEGSITGWYGATGVAMWRAHAMRGNQFRWYPDYPNAPTTYYTCVLVEPKTGAPDKSDDDGRKNISITIRTVDGTYINGY